MYYFIRAILPWGLSGLTFWSMVLAGDKKRLAWHIGLINQVFWMVYVITTKQWGLVPLTILMTGVYIRNLIKWKKNG